MRLKCHAGCENKDIIAALGLKWADLFNDSKQRKPKADIVATYDYCDAAGNLVCQAVRFQPKDFRQRRPDSAKPGQWIWNLNGIDDKPLYRLPELVEALTKHKASGASTKKVVFVVEGEKDVESLRSFGLTATTNIAGAGKWRPQYTRLLKDARIVLLPDNDKPGRDHAAAIAAQHPDAVIVNLPGLSEHGDVSDWIAAGGTREQLIALVREAVANREQNPPPPPKPAQESSDRHYVPLGYNHETLYFWSFATRQIMALSAASIGMKSNLLRLAPLAYWEGTAMGPNGLSWQAATDAVIQECHTAGLFDPSRIRGRGAWWDNERIVLHQGDRLIVDGEETPLTGMAPLKSQNADQVAYVYEQGPRLNIAYKAPLTADECRPLVRICELLPWKSHAAAPLFSGWLAVAPICGVLAWRPHIWITGPSGSGKTWTLENVVGRILGPVMLHVQSVSTEAGLRQALRMDARPVGFDEAEMEDARGQMNIQRVLELMRQASSETGGIIAKGTATGGAQTFAIRSCFCLSSIGVGVHRRADETRVTVLELTDPHRRPNAMEHYAELKKIADEVCTHGYGSALIARSCRLARAIRESAATFALVVANRHNSQRIGDQIGAMLAGWWTLTHDAAVTLGDARCIVEELPLEDLTPTEESTDEQRCLDHLLEQRIRVDVSHVGAMERTVGELVAIADPRKNTSSTVPADLAADTLSRYGFRLLTEGLAVSNSHSAIAAMLEKTPWHVGWHHMLRRIDGATAGRNATRFGGGTSRYTVVPWAAVYANDVAGISAGEQEEVPF